MPLKHTIIVSMDTAPRTLNTIDILPVSLFLNNLWEGQY